MLNVNKLLLLLLILGLHTCTTNGVVGRWCLALMPHWTIMGSVVAYTVETSVVWVWKLGLILCSLPVFASFIHLLITIFACFILLLVALVLCRALRWGVSSGAAS